MIVELQAREREEAPGEVEVGVVVGGVTLPRLNSAQQRCLCLMESLCDCEAGDVRVVRVATARRRPSSRSPCGSRSRPARRTCRQRDEKSLGCDGSGGASRARRASRGTRGETERPAVPGAHGGAAGLGPCPSVRVELLVWAACPLMLSSRSTSSARSPTSCSNAFAALVQAPLADLRIKLFPLGRASMSSSTAAASSTSARPTSLSVAI